LKINFDYPTEQIQMSFGISLKPGENDLPDEIAEELVKGSDALIASIAKASDKKSEEDVRKERKGKGIFTKVVVPEVPVTTTKRSTRSGGGK